MLRKNQKGSAIALVLGLCVTIGILFFAMHTFVSNRELQVYRVTSGIQMAGLAREAILKAHEQFLEKRPSVTSSSYTTSYKPGKKRSIHLYVEEMASKKTRLIAGPGRNEMKSLDSIHYLAVACDEFDCQVAAAEEIFAPEPLYHSDNYEAFDSGLPVAHSVPIRSFSHLTAMAPGEWKGILSDSCEGFEERDCRIEFLYHLRLKNYSAREREYKYGALKDNIHEKIHTLPGVLGDYQVMNLLKGLDKQRTMEQGELYWAMATLERLKTFQSPEIDQEQLSLGEAPNPILDPLLLNQLLALHSPDLKTQSRANQAFQKVYFHNSTPALEHFLKGGKYEERTLRNPESMSSFEVDRGLHAVGLFVNSHCATPIPRDLLEIQKYIEGIRKGHSTYKSPDCKESPSVQVQPAFKARKVKESPWIYYKEKPWVSLESLLLFLKKLGGAETGEFLSESSKKASTETNGNQLVVVPLYLKN